MAFNPRADRTKTSTVQFGTKPPFTGNTADEIMAGTLTGSRPPRGRGGLMD